TDLGGPVHAGRVPVTLVDDPPLTSEPTEASGRGRLADVVWHRRSRFVRRLAVFALANALLVSLAFRAFPQARSDWPQPRHTLSYAVEYLTFGTNQDSWWPMAEA